MFVCVNCRAVFEIPDEVREDFGFNFPPYLSTKVCPECKDDCFVPTTQCMICDEYITGEFVRLKNKKTICENCYTLLNIEDGDIP